MRRRAENGRAAGRKAARVSRRSALASVKRKSASEKQSINYPIQATGSMCLRFSLIYFFYYLRDNNLLNKVKICVTPYDEINCEAPEEIAEDIAQKIYDCMIKAGKIFCTRCKLDADISRDKEGNLPNFWVH